jgi:hypothetical protein
MKRKSADKMKAMELGKEIHLGKPALLSVVWLKAYFDEGSPTFLNATASARKAGYRARKAHTFEQIGYKNRMKYGPKIVEWLDQCGMSETQLKIKLLSLLEARETVFQKLKGTVRQSDLPEGHRVVVMTDEDSLIEVEVAALETQRRSLDMALKIKGIYSPERLEHSGAIATKLEISEEDRKLGQQLVQAAMATLMEAKRAKPA